MAPANPKATAAQPETGAPPSADLDSLLALARQKSLDGRRVVFSTIKDLFFDSEGTLNERERALMADILHRLIHEVELSLRKEIAERLAGEASAPRELIVTLANDAIEVARPVLLNSSVLHDADLIELIRHRTQAHQLAVAMRKNVSENVSRALVDAGDGTVITTLLENDDASISRGTMEYLVAESKRVDSFQNPLVRRRDLPPDLAHKMYWWVSAALRRHIVENFDVDPGVVDDSIEGVVTDRLADESAASAGSLHGGLAEAFAVAKRMAERDLLSEAFLLKCWREGEVSLFEAGFAVATGLRLTLARRLIYEAGGEGLALACKGAGFDAATVISIFELTREASSPRKPPGGRDLERLGDFFRRMPRKHAQSVLTRWRRAPEYLRSMAQLET